MRAGPLLLLGWCFGGLLSAAPASALRIVSRVEHYDAPTETFHFSVTFDRAPDLLTHDQYGRGADEFQYWVTWNLHITDPNYPYIYPDVLVRGGELGAGGIPIRDADGDGGPNSGGWGPIRGIVPYVLTGPTITFDVSRSLLGDSDGQFSYYLMAAEYGGMTDYCTGVSDGQVVPVVRSSWGRLKRAFH